MLGFLVEHELDLRTEISNLLVIFIQQMLHANKALSYQLTN